MPASYSYDASAYRDATERRLGYLAGVARNAERLAARPALSEAGGGRS